MDPGLEYNYTVEGVRVDEVTVYSSDTGYFAGAATIELFTILIVLYTFYGWWRLGRDVSLSPLETAKVGGIHAFPYQQSRILTTKLQAFDAPLLVDIPPRRNGREIGKIEGKRKVQYGRVVHDADAEGATRQRAEKLVIGDESTVYTPNGHRLGAREYLQRLRMRQQAV